MTIVKKIGNVTFKLKIKFSMTNSCFCVEDFTPGRLQVYIK